MSATDQPDQTTQPDQTLRWIPSGVIPPCPCGAGTPDQVRRRDGGDRLHWHCLVCEEGRPITEGWQDPLIAVTDAELRAITLQMQKQAHIREGRRVR
jgi:hypothetical protein